VRDLSSWCRRRVSSGLSRVVARRCHLGNVSCRAFLRAEFNLRSRFRGGCCGSGGCSGGWLGLGRAAGAVEVLLMRAAAACRAARAAITKPHPPPARSSASTGRARQGRMARAHPHGVELGSGGPGATPARAGAVLHQDRRSARGAITQRSGEGHWRGASKPAGVRQGDRFVLRASGGRGKVFAGAGRVVGGRAGDRATPAGSCAKRTGLRERTMAKQNPSKVDRATARRRVCGVVGCGSARVRAGVGEAEAFGSIRLRRRDWPHRRQAAGW